ncbi:cytoplasmic asparaginase I [compost metagenome]
MLSYLFADIPIPLVLTASNYPLTDARSNGLRNFANAIDFAADAALPGVFVLYEDDKGTPLVYLGTRITQAVSFTDQYGSPYNVTYGRMVNRSFQWVEHEQNPQPQALKQQSASKLSWEPETLKIDDRVVYIRPYPGLNYSFYEFTANKPRAILHDLHHSGTACATPEGPYSLVAFIRRCREQGIDFYICPIRDRQAALYSSSLKLIEAGALVIENMSIEAALTKLMLAYGIYEESEKAAAFVTETTLYYERNEV